MSKRTVQLLILTAFVGSLIVPAFAQQAVKIGVVNAQLVLQQSVEGKKAITQMEEKSKKVDADLTKLANDIRALETRMSTQRLTLTAEAALQINSDLEKKRTDQKRLSEDAVRESQELQARLFNKIQSELMEILQAYGKEKALDLIVDSSAGIVYFNPMADITDEIVRRYDASKSAAK
jgi:outer membrane protein